MFEAVILSCDRVSTLGVRKAMVDVVNVTALCIDGLGGSGSSCSEAGCIYEGRILIIGHQSGNINTLDGTSSN